MSGTTYWGQVKRKEIPHIKVGRNVRIRASDLNRWLLQQFVGMFGDVEVISHCKQ